ncbi:MAG TPA: glycoside hydrolase family 27 protein [Lachnospiraceae bacterium]|nr:glycoside hydrolase family 27 protein [Lachnospiraceae bacterium]
MVAKRPPMGWNSWDCFGAAVTEEQVRENAEYMAKNMLSFGWEYVVVDIQWYQPTASTHEYEPFSELCMDEYGRLTPATNRFPSAVDGRGFTALAEYVHSLGLKFGIHIMRGMPRMAAHKNLPILNSQFTAKQVANPNSICFWNPDMYGLRCDLEGAKDYYYSIFNLYASWGVDFIKVDDIAREYPHCQKEIEIISEACKNAGRDMVLSLSPGPAPLERAEHLKKYANMWRITDDFWDEWRLLLGMFERAEKWCTHSGPGHWPDADMLPVGALRQDYNQGDWTKFTKEEQITMMSLWCMMRAPLIAGAHLPKNDEFTLKLLTNADVLEIEVNSHCGHQLYRNETEIAWIAPFKNGKGSYLALFNISEEDKEIAVSLEDFELDGYENCKELWSQKNVPVSGVFKTDVKKHGAVIFRLS